MIKKSAKKIEVVTFATTHKDKFFKDYSNKIEELKESCKKYGIEVTIYGIKELRELTLGSPFRLNLMFRRGAGGWFWKPIIIRHAMDKSNAHYILYLDVDCLILKNPIEILNKSLEMASFGGFQQVELIESWISKRAKKILEKQNQNLKSPLWTAGILAFKNNPESRKYLRIWELGMLNPRLLFEPISDFRKTNHRHDQVVLSYLIGNKSINCVHLGSGFYSAGIESTSLVISEAWVSTGNSIQNYSFSKTDFKERFRIKFRYFLEIIYLLFYYFLVWPTHLIWYNLYKNSNRI